MGLSPLTALLCTRVATALHHVWSSQVRYCTRSALVQPHQVLWCWHETVRQGQQECSRLGAKKERQIEEEYGGPDCTVPGIIDQKVECKHSLETHCNNVYEDYCVTEQVGEECRKEVRKDCKKTYTTECITEWVRECKQEEYIDTEQEEPVKKKRERCQQNPKQLCKSTPEEKCTETPSTVCRPVAQLDCPKILKREDCREIPSLICKPQVLKSIEIPCGGKKLRKFLKKNRIIQ